MIATVRPLLDMLVPALFPGCGAAILVRSKRGPDTSPHLRTEAGELPGQAGRIIAAVPMTSALGDVFVVVANVAGAGCLKPWIISFCAVANLLAFGAQSLSETVNSFSADSEADPAEVFERGERIMDQLTGPLREKARYLDLDLTLAKLSRRLPVPAKQLPAAINRGTGETCHTS